MKLETMKVAHEGESGFAIINKADFDPKVHSKLLMISREEIAEMQKAAVIEYLEAHGVEFDKGARVAELRELLEQTVFVDL